MARSWATVQGAAVCVIVLAGRLCGQLLVTDSSQLAAISADFDRSSAEVPLPCHTALRLRGDSSFGVRAEYQVEMQAGGRSDRGARDWLTIVRVAPQGHAALYLREQGQNLRGSWKGWFWVGDGSYKIDLKVSDQNGGVCRGEAQVSAKSALRLALSPGLVVDGSAGGLADQLARDPRRRLKRLTLLLDAAPMTLPSPSVSSGIPTRLSERDKAMLLDGLFAAIRELPAESVRLICFSLDRQSVVFRDDDFHLASLDGLERALTQLNFGSVDVAILSRPEGHLNLLAQLIKDEIRAEEPAEAAIFLGPQERFRDRPAEPAIKKSKGIPAFFYVRPYVSQIQTLNCTEDLSAVCQDPNRTERASVAPYGRPGNQDGTIAAEVQFLGGRVLNYSDPEGLIRAVERVRDAVFRR